MKDFDKLAQELEALLPSDKELGYETGAQLRINDPKWRVKNAEISKDKPYSRPETLMGREIVPLTGKNAPEIIYRTINSGYGWMGKQIALLDREPITLANYFMFRKQLMKTEANTKKSLMANNLGEEGADSIARASAHETAMNLARNRTLGFVDNGDVRTNLAYSLRTLGRYYRATEDFYRRAGRLVKYESRLIL